MGERVVDLYVRSGDGGEFRAKDRTASITVGLDTRYYEGCFATLLHEATEFLLSDLGVRWDRDLAYGTHADQYLFSFNHAIFSEAMARLSYFLCQAMPKISEAYRDNRKQKAAKEKARKSRRGKRAK